jgi:hypothetical protein
MQINRRAFLTSSAKLVLTVTTEECRRELSRAVQHCCGLCLALDWWQHTA